MRAQRKHTSPMITKVRSMTEADISYLRQKSCVPTIQKLRESHHRVCYLLSTGMTHREIAEKTGYTVGRISILANAPAVQEQVSHYRERTLDIQILADREELKVALGMQQLRMMKDHYDDADAEDRLLPLNDIRADYKAIHGNSGTNVSVNIGFAARLEQAVAATRRLEQDIDA